MKGYIPRNDTEMIFALCIQAAAIQPEFSGNAHQPWIVQYFKSLESGTIVLDEELLTRYEFVVTERDHEIFDKLVVGDKWHLTVEYTDSFKDELHVTGYKCSPNRASCGVGEATS